MAKKKKDQFAYRHKKTGKFLEICYIGDGEFNLNLVDEIKRDCVLNDHEWPLEEIIDAGSGGVEVGVYPNASWLDIYPDDFEEQKVEIVVK